MSEIIDKCEADGYQSDAGYTRMIIRVRSEQLYGLHLVRQDLSLEGISSDVAKLALEEHETDWFIVA